MTLTFFESGRLCAGLSEKIRSRRERLGLSRTELADFLGVEWDTVRRWENGKMIIVHKFLRGLIMDFVSGRLDGEIKKRRSACPSKCNRNLSRIAGRLCFLYSLCCDDASRRRLYKELMALETRMNNRLAEIRRAELDKSNGS